MSRDIEPWELSAFLDGDLPDRRLAEIGRRAAADPMLRARLEAYARDHGVLAELGAEEIEERALPSHLLDLAARLDARLSEDDAHDRARRREARTRPQPRSGSERELEPAGVIAAWSRMLGAGRMRLKSAGLVVAGMMVGLTAGSFAANLPVERPAMLGERFGLPDAAVAFVDEATEIHRVLAFAPEFSPRAGDLDMKEIAELFAISFTPPDLDLLGFRLDRIDVSATDTGPALVLLYRDGEEHVVSMVLSMSSTSLSAVGAPGIGGGASAMTLLTYNDLAVAVGRTSETAFAVTSALSERRVRLLADRLRASLEPVL